MLERRERTVVETVVVCDFCGSDEGVRKCVVCGKDFCAKHGRTFGGTLRQRGSPTYPHSSASSWNPYRFEIPICEECLTPDVERLATRLGEAGICMRIVTPV